MSYSLIDDSENDEQDVAANEKLQADYNLTLVECGSGGIFISDGVDDPIAPRVAAPTEPTGDTKPVKAKRKNAAASGAAAPRKKRAPAKKSAPVSKITRMRETHKRKTTKEATAMLEKAFDTYADSSLKEAHTEASDHVQRIQDELRRIRANLRTTANAPAALRAHAQVVKRVRDSTDGPLLTECADVLEQQSRELRRLEQSFERLAESFSKNSARCLAVTRIAGDSMSRPTIELIGEITSSNKTPLTFDHMDCNDNRVSNLVYKELAPSNNDALVARVNEANGTLARISDQEHPKMAMRIGADGKAAIGISTRPSRMLIEGQPGADYISFSVAREQVAAQSRVQAHGQKRTSATKRIARERQRNEDRVRQMLALEQDAAISAMPLMIGAPSLVPLLEMQ